MATHLDHCNRLRLAGIDPAANLCGKPSRRPLTWLTLTLAAYVFAAHNVGIADISKKHAIMTLGTDGGLHGNPATKIEFLQSTVTRVETNALCGGLPSKRTLLALLSRRNALLLSKSLHNHHHGWHDQKPSKLVARAYLRDRLAELADQGVPMLFAGNASELFGENRYPDGSESEALGSSSLTTRFSCASTMSRWESLILAMARSLLLSR